MKISVSFRPSFETSLPKVCIINSDSIATQKYRFLEMHSESQQYLLKVFFNALLATILKMKFDLS